jgi:spore germination protein D
MLRKKQIVSLLATIVLISTITACGSGKKEGRSQAAEAQPDYNQTKSMVLDILHTKEGMLALRDIMRDPSFKHSLAVNEQDIAQALNKSLTDGPNHQLIEAQMKDPKFAAALVKSTKQEHTELLKTLVKDPEYQKELINILQDPQYTKFQLSLLRTPTARQEIMKVMTEALQNPEFKMTFINSVRESLGPAAITQMQSSPKKDEKKEDGEKKKEDGEKKEEGGDKQEDKKEES